MTALRAVQPARRRRNSQRETIVAYLFLSPWLFGFVVFLAGPMIASLYFSFTEYKVIAPPRWIGLANYTRMFTDDLFFKSLDVSARYTLLSVPLGIAAALSIALLLHQPIIGRGIFRLIFYLPSIISGVAVATVFAWIFNYRFGVLNYLLSLIGVPGPNWLGHPRWALWAFVVMSLWGIGGNVVIFLAALQGVPKPLYEAADLDGATASTKTPTASMLFQNAVSADSTLAAGLTCASHVALTYACHDCTPCSAACHSTARDTTDNAGLGGAGILGWANVACPAATAKAIRLSSALRPSHKRWMVGCCKATTPGATSASPQLSSP